MAAPIKVLYFIAGSRPTLGEQAEIDSMTETVVIGIRQSNAITSLFGQGIEPSDYVAGSVPLPYIAVPVYTGGGGGGGDLGPDFDGITGEEIADALNLRSCVSESLEFIRATADGHLRRTT